ncbi:MAG: galactokinase family protein [Acidimicrobiia bacterium]
MIVEAHAAGRVNVIGEHTDYAGGLALGMAIDRGTTVRVERGGSVVRLRTDHDDSEAMVAIDIDATEMATARIEPEWARFVAGVVAELQPPTGATGTVRSDLPIAAGLSSSASLQLAVALALGFDGNALELATTCQRAEQRATGAPTGILDQLTIASAVDGAFVLLDCEARQTSAIPFPSEIAIMCVDSGERRAVADSAYRERRDECVAAEREIGPLRHATRGDVASIRDDTVRRRAHHVVSENQRVRDFVDALRDARYGDCGALLLEGHASLRDDFEVTTPRLDELVSHLATLPGVYGARMTGAGFGGHVIALCRADTDAADQFGWRARASQGVRVN